MQVHALRRAGLKYMNRCILTNNANFQKIVRLEDQEIRVLFL